LAEKISDAASSMTHHVMSSQTLEATPAGQTVQGNPAVMEGATAASLHIPHEYYSNTDPSMYELSAMWGWPPQSYGEAEVGEPMTDFSNWSLLQYLEEDYAPS